MTQPRPPRQLFHRGRTQPSALCAPLIPPHFQVPLCSCCPTGRRTERFFLLGCFCLFIVFDREVLYLTLQFSSLSPPTHPRRYPPCRGSG